MKILLLSLAYFFLTPLVGGLLSGLDRRISARMQGRIGPPILQPFYDVLKLMEKEILVVRRSQNFYILFFLVIMVFTGGLFFTGEDILLVIFALTLAGIFFILAAYKASSPYSFLGAQRELLQMMAYEPIVIFTAIGMYMVTKSFYVREIMAFKTPLFFYLPGLFFCFVFILAMKLRKSPFDLAASHHAHQELVRGITTEFSGKALAMIEIAHWYENVLVMGFVYLFFAANPIPAVGFTLAIYFLAILIDNTFARVKWQMALKSCWIVAITAGLGNIILMFFIAR
jgi:formate hydrogenlyase subunit 4